METGSASDKGIGFAFMFAVIAVLSAAALAVFGFTGDQISAGIAFGIAILAGGLAVSTYHVYP